MEENFLIKRLFKICLKTGTLLLERIFKIGLFEVFSIESPNEILSVKSIDGLSFSRITKENVTRVLDFREEGHLKNFKIFLNQREYGIFAILNEKVVGHAWAIYSEKNDFPVSSFVTLTKGECVIDFTNVDPVYRGKNIYPAMMAELSRELFEKYKPKRIIGDIDVYNISALKGIVKSGYKHLGYISYVKIFNYVILKKKFYS